MLFDILPLKNNTARLIRVYGDEPCIAVPGEVPGPGGEKWTLTELGDYCFSEKLRNLPAADALCRYEVGGDGAVTLTRAFGRALTGRRRYDLDFGDAPEETDLHPVCGNFLEEAVLPDGLQVIGSCAFYNCRRLRRLSFGAADLTVGSDVFLNCFALADLVVRAEPEAATGLFALVNNITEAVRALFWLPGEAAPRAGLWYPAYWEDVEESPAHILLHTFSGQGYHYRQCFLNGKFLCAEYDAIFPEGHAAEDRNIMAMLCFDRLRWPWNLTEGVPQSQHGPGGCPAVEGAEPRRPESPAGAGCAGRRRLCRGCPDGRQGRQRRGSGPAGRCGVHKAVREAEKETIRF